MENSIGIVDWKHVAEQFLTILEEAVAIRVHSAPDLASCNSHIAVENSQPDVAGQFPTHGVLQSGSGDRQESSVCGKQESGVCGKQESSVSDPQESMQASGGDTATVVTCCGMLHSSGVEMVHGKARIGILYSGGVDSVVLAALVDR